jgi:hypothetical protein
VDHVLKESIKRDAHATCTMGGGTACIPFPVADPTAWPVHHGDESGRIWVWLQTPPADSGPTVVPLVASQGHAELIRGRIITGNHSARRGSCIACRCQGLVTSAIPTSPHSLNHWTTQSFPLRFLGTGAAAKPAPSITHNAWQGWWLSLVVAKP